LGVYLLLYPEKKYLGDDLGFVLFENRKIKCILVKGE
jgi:hypothetical protein